MCKLWSSWLQVSWREVVWTLVQIHRFDLTFNLRPESNFSERQLCSRASDISSTITSARDVMDYSLMTLTSPGNRLLFNTKLPSSVTCVCVLPSQCSWTLGLFSWSAGSHPSPLLPRWWPANFLETHQCYQHTAAHPPNISIFAKMDLYIFTSCSLLRWHK